MRPKNVMLFLVAGIFFLAVISGCTDATTKDQREEPSSPIQSLTFEAGSFFGGYCTYEIQKEKDTFLFSAGGMNGINMNITDEKLTEEEISSVETWLTSNHIENWKGFDESNKKILDGHSFSLSVTYEDGTTLVAKGYEKYPRDYDRINPEKFFMDLAKAHGYKE